MKYRKKRKESNLLYRFTMGLMCCMIGALLYMINDKTQYITVDKLQQFSISNATQFLFWENLFQDKSEQVSMNIDYHLLKDHYYSNGSNTVTALLNGVALKVEENRIVVLCDNGVSITYENMNEVMIKQDERVMSGDVIGMMEESVVLHFYYDDQEISKEEALAME